MEAIGAALAGSDKPFVATFATLSTAAAPGCAGTEEDAGVTTGMMAARSRNEEPMLALAAKGVRASIIRLPPSVHGTGDRGFVPTLVALARKNGLSAYIKDGKNRWPAVHVLDAARLYRLALEKGQPGRALPRRGKTTASPAERSQRPSGADWECLPSVRPQRPRPRSSASSPSSSASTGRRPAG